MMAFSWFLFQFKPEQCGLLGVFEQRISPETSQLVTCPDAQNDDFFTYFGLRKS